MTKDEHIEEIMNWFDFDRVERTMVALDWKWWDSPEVPTYDRLKAWAENLLSETYDRGKTKGFNTYTSTGGFVARYYPEFDQLELHFCVADWQTNES